MEPSPRFRRRRRRLSFAAERLGGGRDDLRRRERRSRKRRVEEADNRRDPNPRRGQRAMTTPPSFLSGESVRSDRKSSSPMRSKKGHQNLSRGESDVT